MVSLLKACRDLAELFVDSGHFLLKFSDRHRGSDSCNNVFTLSIDEELTVELLFAG